MREYHHLTSIFQDGPEMVQSHPFGSRWSRDGPISSIWLNIHSKMVQYDLIFTKLAQYSLNNLQYSLKSSILGPSLSYSSISLILADLTHLTPIVPISTQYRLNWSNITPFGSIFTSFESLWAIFYHIEPISSHYLPFEPYNHPFKVIFSHLSLYSSHSSPISLHIVLFHSIRVNIEPYLSNISQE